jgi:hypothetical protein
MCQSGRMCRNIRTLSNFAPPATADEMHAAAVQFVRKVTGTTAASASNREAFDDAVQAITEITRDLLDGWVTSAPARNREVEAERARQRNIKRFGVPA